MSGTGGGYCVMRLPAGHTKESREQPQGQKPPEAVSLQQQIGRLDADLARLNQRLTALEATVHAQAGKSGPTKSGKGRGS